LPLKEAEGGAKMIRQTMQEQGNGSILGGCITIVLFIVSQLTLHDFAAIATIIAACVTTCYTLYKWRAFINKNKKDYE